MFKAVNGEDEEVLEFQPDSFPTMTVEPNSKYQDPAVADEMGIKNELGVTGVRVARNDEELEELPAETYNSEEERLLDELADAWLRGEVLGICIPATSTDSEDFSAMISDLLEAKTEEEFDLVLACYGNPMERSSIKKFVEYKTAKERAKKAESA
jgi:hypothetical protein